MTTGGTDAGGGFDALAGGGGGGRRRRKGDPLPRDEFDDILDNIPDFAAVRRTTLTLLAKKQERDRRAAAQAAAQAEVEREVEEQREEEANARAVLQQIEAVEALQARMQSLEEYRVADPVLQALPPPQEADQDDIDVDAEYLGALAGARAALGLDDALPDLAASKQDRLELFRAGLRSGYVRSAALRRGSAGAPLVAVLLSTVTQSPDAEAAGAAFVTLMALMGDEAACGQQTAAAAAASHGQQEACGEEQQALAASSPLLLDAHFGLAPGRPLPACTLECVPTDEQLLEALRANGYRPSHGGHGSGSGSGGRRRQQDPQQDAQEEQEQQEGGGEGQEGHAVRLQAVKLIFRTAAAVCRFCQQHPGSPAARGALGREGLGELLLAALHLLLDPHAAQMAEDLEEAATALLEAFEEGDWQRKLPQLADRLAELGPSHHARLKLLRKLPVSHPRGLALQQYGGAVLLERLLPAPRSGHHSAINRRGGELDPAAVIAAQPWFADGKGLVTGATSGGREVPRGGYPIGSVELLLKVCHLLLWPHMLRHAAGEPSCVGQSSGFLPGWHDFLGAVQKNIKGLVPEDQSVKFLANFIDLQYSCLVQDAGLVGPMSP